MLCWDVSVLPTSLECEPLAPSSGLDTVDTAATNGTLVAALIGSWRQQVSEKTDHQY